MYFLINVIFMKRMIVMTMVALLGIFHSTQAQDHTTHAPSSSSRFQVIPTGKPGVFQASYSGPMSKTILVSLVDEDQVILSTKVFNNLGSFSQQYNLRAVEPGEYTWVVRTAEGKTAETLSYEGLPRPAITLIPDSSSDRLKLIVSDQSKEEVTVSLFDEEDHLLHTQKVDPTSYVQHYNLEQLTGSYVTFVVTNDETGKTSSESFALK